jgi:hypothetical protein
MYNTEHFSEHVRDEWQMSAFCEMVEDCDLQDLGFYGQPFTWDNRQDGRENVKARLDRACGTEELCQLFQVLRVRHINMVQSDHCMLAIEMKKYKQQRFTKGRNFKYENVWQTHADYDKVVNDLWMKAEKGTGLSGFANSLSSVQSGLER